MKRLLKTLVKNKIFYLGMILIAVFIVGTRMQIQKKKTSGLILYTVKRQNLVISIIEGGNLIALESQKIINNVPGTRNILEVVDEGTQITEEDVKNGRVLIKLDSKDLEDKRDQLAITVENSLADYTQAEQELEILKKDNENSIAQAELNVRFAEIDLKEYLGDSLAQDIIDNNGKLDIPSLIKSDKLGGDALNKKRTLENNIDLTKEQVELIRSALEAPRPRGMNVVDGIKRAFAPFARTVRCFHKPGFALNWFSDNVFVLCPDCKTAPKRWLIVMAGYGGRNVLDEASFLIARLVATGNLFK